MAERRIDTGPGSLLRDGLLRLQPLRRMGPLARHLCAAALILLAFAARLLVAEEFGAFPFTFLTFLPAVVTAALLFGRGTGFFATVLAALLATEFLRAAFSDLRVAVSLAGFLALGFFISAVLEALSSTVERLVEQERELRATFEQAAVGLAHVGLDGRWLRVNDKLCQIVGYPCAELLALRFQDLTHAKDLATNLDHMRRLLAGEIATYTLQKRYLRKDGRTVWIEVTVALLRHADGTPDHFIAVIQDITIRHEMEAELRASELRLRQFLESAPQPMWLLRPDGSIEYFNGAMRSYAGFQRTPAADEWLDAVHPDDRGRVLEVRASAVAAGREWQTELRLRRWEDGSWRWHATHVKPLRDADGTISAWVGTAIDIDAIRRLNEELEARVAERTAALRKSEEALVEARKMEAIGRSAGTIAHDYNNILQAVIGNLMLIERRTRDDVRMSKLVANAQAAAERGERLAQELLAFARRQKLEPEPIDVGTAIVDLRELLARTLPAEVELRIELAEGLPPAMADLGQLERALLNLVLNGRDAMMPDGGVLTIETGAATLADPAGEFVLITVRDTGHGMAPEVRERAFEPFFSTKPRGSGTGLGLSQVYGFARQSGGTIALETAAGEGTAIRLFLPVAVPQQPARAAAAAAGPAEQRA